MRNIIGEEWTIQISKNRLLLLCGLKIERQVTNTHQIHTVFGRTKYEDKAKWRDLIRVPPGWIFLPGSEYLVRITFEGCRSKGLYAKL